MINLDDFIVKESSRKSPRFEGEVTRTKYFKCTCDGCGKDKGYLTKSRYDKKPLCVKCATNTDKHKETLVKNHWSKTNNYVPTKKYHSVEELLERRVDKLTKASEYGAEYYQNNKASIREYRKKRRDSNLNVKLASNLRTRTANAVKNGQKGGSAVRDLGCSIEEFKKHIESQFESDMTWDNWAIDGWHIDHIKPLSGFDLTDREQFLEATRYTNQRPLWAKDNLSKNNRVD